MSIFKDFEKKLESLFEGVFLRAFKSGVHPVELGKKLVRELEGHKTIGVKRVYVPNRYEVGLSPKDYGRFESYQAVMATELENLLISYIKEKQYAVLDRPRIKLVEDGKMREGDFWIKSSMEGEIPTSRQAEPAPGEHVRRSRRTGPAVLELISDEGAVPVFPLDRDVHQVGRLGDNDIVIPDPNVSRVHARITRKGDDYILTDLQSTNGTWINKEQVSEVRLEDEDVICMGSTRLIFRRSD